jgi:hypothetical protein
MSEPSNAPASIATLAALIAGRLAPAEIPAAQWRDLLVMAVRERLGPLLYWAVKRADPDFTFAPVWNAVVSLTRLTAVQNVLLRHTQLRVGMALKAAGVSPIWTKGIVLIASAYPEPALRPMNDLDVMVPFAQRFAALEVLQALGGVAQRGFIKFPRIDDPLVAYAYYAYDFALTLPYHVAIDLHFRLPGRLLPTARFSWFWDHTRTSPEGIQTLTLETHLLYLCGHMILHHGEGHYRTGSYADVHFLITNNSLDWDLLVRLAAELQWTYALERVLTLTLALFDTSVPPEVLAQLRAQHHTSGNVAMALKLRDHDPRGENTLDQLRYMPLWQRVRFIWYTIVPARVFIRYLYHIETTTIPLWPYYLRRWTDLARVGWHTVIKRIRWR